MKMISVFIANACDTICYIYLPRQLALVGHIVVAFCIKYAFNVVNDGLFRNVSSSFFHTYVTCDSSYDTVE